MPANRDNIVITSGSQQALDLMARLFVNEGDEVLVECPPFVGALQAFNAYGARYVTVPMDQDGLRVDVLAEVLATHKPKFMYLQPTFQNPAGVTLTLERRRQVVKLAAEAGVPILEDDPYGQLRFAGAPLPTLASLDMEQYPENAAAGRYVKGNVVYLSTFSKTLAPACAPPGPWPPPRIANQFVMGKQGADLQTNALSQALAYEFLQRGLLPAQVARIRNTYLERRNAMVAAIQEFFPPEIEYSRPDGGLFLWLTLPEGMDTVPMVAEAAAHKVAFVPGAPFFANGGGQNTMRLSFASMSPEIIREGIERLAGVIRSHLA
jgi:2-aminoadipate transaminase